MRASRPALASLASLASFASLASLVVAAAACRPGAGAPATNAAASGPVAAGPATPPAPPAPPAPQAHRFRIGTLEAFALKDGELHEANDGKTFGLGHTPAEVSALLAAAGAKGDTIDLSIQPLLVRDEGRVLLFDTGAANVSWAPLAGQLLGSLRAAGLEPEAVTDVFVSHSHPDHVAGLVTAKGQLAFPRAAIHLSAPEWAFLQKDEARADFVKTIAPRVVPFAPGAVLFPSVTAVPVEGHTPGHSAYLIGSGTARLLYVGDALHSSIVSVQRPDWPVDYDMNQDLARKSRRALLARVAAEHLPLYGVHFPFPGVGHVTASGDSFVWSPD